MAIYLVTGKLGSGKTLACVGRIRDALKAGKRVVTNLDLNLCAMFPGERVRCDVVRIPDKPNLGDLELVGLGNPERDESRNGLIVLDELGAWLNTRSWGDKERQPVIDWLLHSRKLGWDVYFIIQHANMLDKQIREGLAEFLVTCRRTDRLRIPLLSGLFKGWGVDLRPPQVHVATVRYGIDPQAVVSDRWWYRARDLWNAYDTRQVFTGARDGPYTLLSPYHVKRGTPEGMSSWDRLKAWVMGRAQPAPSPRPKAERVRALQKLPPDYRVRLWQRLEAGFGPAHQTGAARTA